ncbi:xanthine dehydrogenase 1 [Manduca sexta]|uniref:xanthine dehydrogenase 1 n=1 Tax=Manduca sexta TaxID=7130 RepID=UPI00188DF9F3|nr:xanthine dehydrogenase 1 [Manduca sexta]
MTTTTKDTVKFKVNGIECEVGSEISSQTKLIDYIRKTLNLSGTKYMCREAGCGACIVSASKGPGEPGQAVNSCLVSVTSCQDWEITTIEGLGNRKTGYHVLQETLAENNATQCGHCTPGWIMSMYSLLQRKTLPTMREIEQSFASNVCRCTGYRPIFKALKKFASDSPQNDLPNIKELYGCQQSGVACNKKCSDDWCLLSKDALEKTIVKINLQDNRTWYKVSEIDDVFDILDVEGDDSYMFVAGNSARVPYPIQQYPRVLIDVTGIDELKNCEIDQNLIIGAGTTLTNLLDVFEEISKEGDFWYLHTLREHVQKVAHISVRNLATLAGNLMIKYQHRDFPSDLFLLLECIGAQLSIYSRSDDGSRKVDTVTMQEFLDIDMTGKIIVNALLPPLSNEYKIATFKIMPRAQGTHAIVNAGFLYQLTDDYIVTRCRIVYGGLSNQFIRARNTENFLVGKHLFTNDTLQNALKVLDNELVITSDPLSASVEFRRKLTLALYYKGLLTICPEDKIQQQYRSGAIKVHSTRPVSSTTQVFKTDASLWPLNQPVNKVEALLQCAGEAVYTEDLPRLPNEMSAFFVLTDVPTGEIVSIDASKALAYEGVIAFYSAKHIPGLNSFTPADDNFGHSNEEVFCDGTVKYHGQPLGIVVAESYGAASAAAGLVDVTYKNVKTPVLTIEEARKDSSRVTLHFSAAATSKGDNVVKVIKSGTSIFTQYHFPMENMSCLAQPSEEGLKVHATAQWLDATQLMISRALNIQQNKVDVHLRRLGGSYGQKITRTIQSAVACSLAAFLLNRPCRLIMPMQVTTKAAGKRFPCQTEYEVGVDDSGKIQYMNYDLYDDNGYLINELIIELVSGAYNNCYDKSTWNFRSFNVTTDTHKNSWFRSPGNLEATYNAELIMEQIACELGLDPLDVRLVNIADKYAEIKEMIEHVRKNSNYDERRKAVDKFNSENRWLKRGLRFSTIRWSPIPVGNTAVNMSVYHGDGSISLTHGGIEVGQGLNTKAIQICAYLLNIPMDKIQVKENNTTIGPNVYATGASLGSQNVNIGVTQCCEELLKRLEPIRQKLTNPTWEELIKTAHENNVNLQTTGFLGIPDIKKFAYDIYGVVVAEVEVDVLTGEFEVIRVDLEEDVGLSTSPFIDIGQIEGGFLIAQGYWTCEEIIRDKTTGEMLTNRPWNYYVPLGTDIPQDFRVYFRENSYSFKELFGAKVTGEPPLCMAGVIPFAIREAITSARVNSGIPATEWFPVNGPYTVEKIGLAMANKQEDFKF